MIENTAPVANTVNSTVNSMNPDKLTFCIWYLTDQHALYKDYFSGFHKLVSVWDSAIDTLPKEDKPIEESIPDICGCCLRVFGHTNGGRVRIVCSDCYTRPWSGAFLKFDYRQKLAEILNMEEYVLESYLALALWHHKHAQLCAMTKEKQT